MSTIPSVVTETTSRQSVEEQFYKAQAEVTAAASAVAELESKLASERGFREKLSEKFDNAAVNEDQASAEALHAEISRTDFRLRGLELRLETSRAELAEHQGHAASLAEQLTKLQYAEAIEAEGAELRRMIEAANTTYVELVRVAEKFESAIIGLKSREWLDNHHRSDAANEAFRLAGLCKGMNL
jgi:hypothetical protein